MTGGRSPKNKGDRYERAIVAYLQSRGIQVERAKRGNKTGDILGHAEVVLEAKDQTRFALASWLDQALDEREEAGARHAIVIAKRPRRGDVGRHYFIMEVEDGISLLEEAGYLHE